MKHIRNDFVFHATTVEEAAALLNSDVETGLSTESAQERLQHFGRNAITEARSLSLVQILINQLKSPIVFLLLFAAGMSFWFKEWLDAIAILIVVLTNTLIGFYMEFKARQSMLVSLPLAFIATSIAFFSSRFALE